MSHGQHYAEILQTARQKQRRYITRALLVSLVGGLLVALVAILLAGGTSTPAPSLQSCVAGIKADPMADTAATPGCIGLSEADQLRAESIALGGLTGLVGEP